MLKESLYYLSTDINSDRVKIATHASLYSCTFIDTYVHTRAHTHIDIQLENTCMKYISYTYLEDQNYRWDIITSEITWSVIDNTLICCTFSFCLNNLKNSSTCS